LTIEGSKERWLFNCTQSQYILSIYIEAGADGN
jgi:hypothetical protein